MRKHPLLAAGRAISWRLPSLPVAVGAVIALAAGGSGAQAATRPVVSTSVAAPGASPVVAGTWKLLPKAPVASLPGDATAVWTGREVIIHGNYFPGAGGIRGVTFAYLPATGKWVRLANGPAGPSAYETTDIAVWTGSRDLVFGQTSAIYNPAANTWRQMPRGIIGYGAVTGWTGRLFFAWGGTCCMDESHDGYAYSLASNTWRQLPTAPLSVRRDASGTWTGRELVVAGGFRFGFRGPDVYFRDAAAYNQATGKWRKIAPMPRREWGATAVWDGKEILFIGGSVPGVNGPPARGLAYNPRTNRWWLLPTMAYPRFGFAAVWTGRQLLVWGGLTAKRIPPPHGEAYTPATGKWTALRASPLRGRSYPVAVWTGRQMFVWGGSSSSGSGFTDGAIYTPSAQVTSVAGHAWVASAESSSASQTAAVPASFRPASASFVSSAWGVALGGVACTTGKVCLARLAVTADGGEAWHWINTPGVRLWVPNAPSRRSVVSQVVFASRRNGWLFNQNVGRLWATHDGGAHWRRLSLPGGISALVTSGGTAYALAGGKLFRSPAGKDAWVRAGTVTGSSLAAFGKAAWVGTTSYLWTTADGGVHWHKYRFHCAGASYFGLAGIAAASTSRVFFLCVGNGAAGSIGKELMLSVNGGRTQQRAGQPPLGGSYPLAITVPPYRGKTVLVGASFRLYRTADGGESWTIVIGYNQSGVWSYLAYVSPTTGWAVDGVYPLFSQSRLLRTLDQGRSWQAVRF
jgi:hypothetical protein